MTNKDTLIEIIVKLSEQLRLSNNEKNFWSGEYLKESAEVSKLKKELETKQ